jgi:hypothetical protein
MTVGDTCSYIISNASGSEWESGIATYSSANTLTRTSVKSSSNSNNRVVFTGGVKDVFIGVTADSVVDKNNARLNTINAIPVASGIGNDLTLIAGSGVGVGAGGNIVLTPGSQGSSGGDGNVGIGQNAPTAKLHVTGTSASTKVAIVQGASSQTANLQEWQNSSGTALASVSSSGNFQTSAINLLNGNYANGTTPALIIGADIGSTTTRTNATRKLGAVCGTHYTTTNASPLIFSFDSDSSYSRIGIGGGFNGYNAASQVWLYTAANTNTVSGTPRLKIDENGNVVLTPEQEALLSLD